MWIMAMNMMYEKWKQQKNMDGLSFGWCRMENCVIFLCGGLSLADFIFLWPVGIVDISFLIIIFFYVFY